MPNPSQVRAQDINTELGVSSTVIIPLSNNWVKNVAAKSSLSNTNIKYGEIRWGINFPGGSLTNDGYVKTYGGGLANLPNTYFYMFAFDTNFGAAGANTSLTIYSNGVMKMEVVADTFGTQSHHVTWLTSGVNSDYTAQLKVNDAVAIGGVSQLNTDLVLSSTRSWHSGAFSNGGQASNYANCELIIKDSGGTLITRPIYFQSFAEAF